MTKPHTTLSEAVRALELPEHDGHIRIKDYAGNEASMKAWEAESIQVILNAAAALVERHEAQEPVGTAVGMPGTADGFTMCAFEAKNVPVGTLLYAQHPQVSATPVDGCQGERAADEKAGGLTAAAKAPFHHYGLSAEEVDQLLQGGLKPEEIGGAEDTQHDRVGELVRWFARFTQGQANPKWATRHACELAYYIATNGVNRGIDLKAVRDAAFKEGVNITPEERGTLERVGFATPPPTLAATQAGDAKDAARWRFRKQFLADGGAVVWSRNGCQYRKAHGILAGSGETEEDAIDAEAKLVAIQPQAAAGKMDCPSCGKDRFKEPCPNMADECPMIADAHLLAPPALARSQVQAAGDAVDAARYRFLRNGAWHSSTHPEIKECLLIHVNHTGLDAAIDAAMREQQS
jgi:hypothetical protein